jgi:hypothetical protein
LTVQTTWPDVTLQLAEVTVPVPPATCVTLGEVHESQLESLVMGSRPFVWLVAPLYSD